MGHCPAEENHAVRTGSDTNICSFLVHCIWCTKAEISRGTFNGISRETLRWLTLKKNLTSMSFGRFVERMSL